MGVVVQFPKYPPLEYRLSAASGVGEIVLYGVIGMEFDGITSAQFLEDLKRLSNVATINVHINSPGGIVTEGVAIFNRLKAHPARKIVHVDGEASSIASLIAMAGDEIHMGEGSLMCVHKARIGRFGTDDELIAAAASCTTVDRQTLIPAYAKRTGMKPDALMSLMKEDRYMSADEAVGLRFANSVVGGKKMAALAVDRAALNLPPLPAPIADRPNRAKALALMRR
jgi:ATP-dependent protease ClpP protease subunit